MLRSQAQISDFISISSTAPGQAQTVCSGCRLPEAWDSMHGIKPTPAANKDGRLRAGKQHGHQKQRWCGLLAVAGFSFSARSFILEIFRWMARASTDNLLSVPCSS